MDEGTGCDCEKPTPDESNMLAWTSKMVNVREDGTVEKCTDDTATDGLKQGVKHWEDSQACEGEMVIQAE